MTNIDLSSPVGSERERSDIFPFAYRTIFVYECSQGHTVRVGASSFRGQTPVPSVGAITCPQCAFKEKYP